MNVKTDSSECELCSLHASEDSESVWEKHRVLIIAASTALFGAGFAVEYLTKNVLYGHAIFLGVILLSGREIIGAALSSVIRRRLDVNFLMTVAAFGAFAIGQADEGAAVMYLFSLAEYLENAASGKVRAGRVSSRGGFCPGQRQGPRARSVEDRCSACLSRLRVGVC